MKLMNDFYHIKYDHNTNDNTESFDAFNQYLTDSNNSLKCDMSHCPSVQRYYRNRNQLQHTENAYSINILSRCHTYFIHSYEISRFTPNEINYIESQVNEFKTEQLELKDVGDELADKRAEITLKIINEKRQKALPIQETVDNDKYITDIPTEENKFENKTKSSFAPLYNQGIPFWYWENDLKPKNAIYVSKKYDNLKQEILADKKKKINIAQWKYLVDDCNGLQHTFKIKQISKNNNDECIYGIKIANKISMPH
eukprot:479471_1